MEEKGTHIPPLPRDSRVSSWSLNSCNANTLQAAAIATPSLLQTFSCFPDLPTEIRFTVWRYVLAAIYCPAAARIIINFNLNQPRAIIPSLGPRVYDGSDSDSVTTVWDSDSDISGHTPAHSYHHIPAMLHACHEARIIALDSYRFDQESIVPGENKLWWDPEEDTIYIPDLHRITIREKTLYTSLSSLQHLALPLHLDLLNKFTSPQSRWGYLHQWFSTLPALTSLILLTEPYNKFDADEGRILLYEPYNVPIDHLLNNKASEIEDLITAEIKSWGLGWDPPLVEVLAIRFRKNKQKRHNLLT